MQDFKKDFYYKQKFYHELVLVKIRAKFIDPYECFFHSTSNSIPFLLDSIKPYFPFSSALLPFKSDAVWEKESIYTSSAFREFYDLLPRICWKFESSFFDVRAVFFVIFFFQISSCLFRSRWAFVGKYFGLPFWKFCIHSQLSPAFDPRSHLFYCFVIIL